MNLLSSKHIFPSKNQLERRSQLALAAGSKPEVQSKHSLPEAQACSGSPSCRPARRGDRGGTEPCGGTWGLREGAATPISVPPALPAQPGFKGFQVFRILARMWSVARERAVVGTAERGWETTPNTNANIDSAGKARHRSRAILAAEVGH